MTRWPRFPDEHLDMCQTDYALGPDLVGHFGNSHVTVRGMFWYHLVESRLSVPLNTNGIVSRCSSLPVSWLVSSENNSALNRQPKTNKTDININVY